MLMRNSRLPFLFAIAVCLAAQSSTPIDNDQVRVILVTDQPHAKTQPHQHKLNRVMIYLTPGSQSITPQNGKKVDLKYKAGEVKWSPAGGMHVSEVTSDAPVRIVCHVIPACLSRLLDATPTRHYTAMASKGKSDVKVLKGQDGARLCSVLLTNNDPSYTLAHESGE